MNSLPRPLHRFRLARCTGGAIFLETALALAAALPATLFGFELCMMTYTESVLSDAVHQGVRYAVVHGTDSGNCSGPSTGCADPSGANVEQVVTATTQNSLHNMAGLAMSIQYPDNSSAPGSHVQVRVSYVYVPYLSFAGLSQTLSASGEGVIAY